MASYQDEFIENLKNSRNRAGLSQAKLAEICEVSTGTIGNIECGKTKPSFDLLFKLADALNTSASELVKCGSDRKINYEEVFSKVQLDMVSETMNSAIKEAVENAIKQLQYEVIHSNRHSPYVFDDSKKQKED